MDASSAVSDKKKRTGKKVVNPLTKAPTKRYARSKPIPEAVNGAPEALVAHSMDQVRQLEVEFKESYGDAERYYINVKLPGAAMPHSLVLELPTSLLLTTDPKVNKIKSMDCSFTENSGAESFGFIKEAQAWVVEKFYIAHPEHVGKVEFFPVRGEWLNLSAEQEMIGNLKAGDALAFDVQIRSISCGSAKAKASGDEYNFVRMNIAPYIPSEEEE